MNWTKEHGNKKATLCGWAAARRDHGEPDLYRHPRPLRPDPGRVRSFGQSARTRLPRNLGPRFVVRVAGTVAVRAGPKWSTKISLTGEIELCAEESEILNPSEVPVFEITDEIEPS